MVDTLPIRTAVLESVVTNLATEANSYTKTAITVTGTSIKAPPSWFRAVIRAKEMKEVVPYENWCVGESLNP